MIEGPALEKDKASEAEDLIAELCVKAPSEGVKCCLRSYKAGRTIDQIKVGINKSKIAVLVETSAFLRIPNSAHLKKDELSHLILCRIQNLLPDNCNICKQRYCIELEDAPFLDCAICGQGVHKKCWLDMMNIDSISDRDTIVNKYINPCKLPGIFYLCSECEDRTIPKEPNQPSKKVSKPAKQSLKEHPIEEDINAIQKEPNQSSKKASKHAKQPVQERAVEEASTADEVNDEDLSNRQEVQAMESTESTMVKEDHGSIPSQESSSAGSSGNEGKPDKSVKKFDKICRYFRRGTCKHGLRGAECRYQHPRMCRKYIEHGTRQPNGCTLGIKCKQFHPLMCLDSMRKSECFDENCSFHHIKGTRRQPTLVKNNHQECLSPHPTSQKSRVTGPQTQNPSMDTTTPEKENQTGHFLEVIRLMKAEILSQMNHQIASLTAQIQSIQPSVHQIVPPPMMPYPQQAISQTTTPLTFTTLPPRGAQQPIQRVQFQTPPRM